MIRPLAVATLLAFGPMSASAQPFHAMFPDHPGYDVPGLMEILTDLDYRQGHIPLPGGRATLDVPDGFYYLDPRDTETVLTRLWGNPGGEALGMIFPAPWTPWDEEAWGAELTWEGIGHVGVVDAEVLKGPGLLMRMQRETRLESEARLDAGFAPVTLVGWATAPHYDAARHTLHWALVLDFGDTEHGTLNYRIRALGRDGVLSANVIGTVDQFDQISADIPALQSMIRFRPGARYTDFDPKEDRLADTGLAGLIAPGRN